ncbi:MAG: cobalamin-binding protein [Acidobacteriota bacterium]
MLRQIVSYKNFPIILLAALLAACQSPAPSPENARVLTDELGRAIRVKTDPQRIISLAPSITEILFALGAGDRIAGVTTFCDYPAETSQKEKVGDTLRPSVEKIVSLKPDLVIISTSSQLEGFLKKLEEIGIPVYINNPRNIDETISSIERIGEVIGLQNESRELASSLRARVQKVRSRADSSDHPRVLFMLGTEPLIVPGRRSFINNLIEEAGGRSVSADADADYPQFSYETALARQPEIIFLQSGEDPLPDRLKATPAAQAGRVYRLDDALLLRPGPRIVDGLEQMAAKIHP